MRVHSIPTVEGFTFACSRRAIYACFARDRIDWISFGSIGKHFEFDSRTEQRPELSGTVVAALTYCPDGSSYLCLYPVRKDIYAGIGASSFAEVVLPRFREWLDTREKQSGVAGSTHKMIIAEWTGSHHLFHELSALYASH